MVQLFDDERLDYLLANETMQIIQSPSAFSFSLDAVLLAHFAYVPIKKGTILDLCSGNGVIPLLLSRRTNAYITGVEIQKRLFDMAERNVQLNELEKQINMIHGDLKEMQPKLAQSHFDVVTCNPPYFRTPQKTELNKNDYLTIARHEVFCTLEDVVRACKLYVRPGGKVAMVHRPGRLVDIISLFRKYKLEPKRMQLVYPKTGRDANMLLVEGIRDGNADLTILPPLYIYNHDNTYTKEAKDIIYGR
ncbi:tRNA1(Val) (adenine(37)-N6)-methyltransferase [Virgibacillus ndiopensis]|uniref:tRNA1(Val) (adenine(37)-N6)-methyltransferase n=1 Tax=Virgibacillus ndiopensis TaxID=2004408 RepID=UPI000C06A246|nr:tRNA1(Val) (adenine(37)-N6)-methyltransferase [Virgibacillus ndiopensis]